MSLYFEDFTVGVEHVTRGRTITVAYLARVDPAQLRPVAADDASEVAWHRLYRLPSLAFDHAKILACARRRMKR